ncbi:unnamed protein product, partial [Rotaria sp. Silwood1]
KDLNNQNEEEQKLAIHCLEHYLRSLRISQVNLTTNQLVEFYQKYHIEIGLNIDMSLKKLSEFLQDLFEQNEEIFSQNVIYNENQQYLVRINHSSSTTNQISLLHDFDLDTCCILLNIFQNQLPSSYQILWCSNTTDEDIHLFF